MHGDEPAEAVPAWTAGAVARHLGVAPSTLRTWSRRYGLDPAGRDSGRHRRYLASDIVRLDAMRRLVAQGVAPAAAARWVHTQPLAALDSAPEPAGSVKAPVPARVVRGLVAAALRLDGDAMAAALCRHLSERGVIDAWNQICLPVITEIGQAVERDGCIDVEHLLSWTISATLHQVPAAARVPGRRVALLAGAVTAYRPGSTSYGRAPCPGRPRLRRRSFISASNRCRRPPTNWSRICCSSWRKQL